MLKRILVQHSNYLAKTVASIQFDQHGQRRDIPAIEIVDTLPASTPEILCVPAGAVYTNFEQGQYEIIATKAQEEAWLDTQAHYVSRITKHLWITNNEPIVPVTGTQYLGPASGVCWLLNLCRPCIESATLVDISQTQLDFADHVLSDWDGNSFGEFVVRYMFKNHVMSFTVDHHDVAATKELLKQRSMASYVDHWLDAQLEKFGIDNLAQAWQQARHKPVALHNSDLVQWVLATRDVHGLWASNVSDFKYTLLTNAWEDIQEFERRLHG